MESLLPGEASDEGIRRYYDRLSQQGLVRGFLPERLEKVLTLPRKNWNIPEIGIDGYSIITFHHTENVLLECPIYGNAIYIVNSDEERWMRMTKQELIESGKAKKVPHQSDWFARHRKAIELQ